MTDLELIRESVAKHAAKILDANDRIWDYAELAFHERKSAELLAGCWRRRALLSSVGWRRSPPALPAPTRRAPANR